MTCFPAVDMDLQTLSEDNQDNSHLTKLNPGLTGFNLDLTRPNVNLNGMM